MLIISLLSLFAIGIGSIHPASAFDVETFQLASRNLCQIGGNDESGLFVDDLCTTKQFVEDTLELSVFKNLLSMANYWTGDCCEQSYIPNAPSKFVGGLLGEYLPECCMVVFLYFV